MISELSFAIAQYFVTANLTVETGSINDIYIILLLTELLHIDEQQIGGGDS